MDRLRASLATHFAVIAFAAHLLLLPPLYFGISAAVRSSYETQFVDRVRAFARMVTDQLELGRVVASPKLTLDILDSVILNGDGVYAEMRADSESLRSELSRRGVSFPAKEDFAFGAHGDDVYYVSMEIRRGEVNAVLRLGFDEQPTLQQIRGAERRVFWVLASYFILSMLLVVGFGRLLARPVERLQRAARSVASGNYGQDMRLPSRVRELHQLAEDLERMRTELVDTLQQRSQLEQRLHHRHRLETVGTLAGGIAHEFNNVLVPITLLTEATVRQLPPGSASVKDLESVLLAARRARDLVRQILTFSRGLSAARLEWHDPVVIVRQALSLFEPLVSPNTRVEADFEARCPQVRVDQTLAVQLVLNLLTNAYQALQGAPGSIGVGLRVVDGSIVPEGALPTARFVELRVSDAGQGMDAATLERIFEPFYTTRGIGEGTGLGLSVVHGIAKSFGATIDVASTVGRGSTFRVYLPCLGGAATALEY
jgi:signal transduction histidine kinase